MYTIIVATHSNLSKGLLDTLGEFHSDLSRVLTVSLDSQGVETFEETIDHLLEEVDTPILGFVDLFQGTPFKVLYSKLMANPENVIITNVNFGSLLTAVLQSHQELGLVKEEIFNAGEMKMIDGTVVSDKNEEDE